MDETGTGVALNYLLDASENAYPVEAVHAVTRELVARLGAAEAHLLIADLSGRALVRLSDAAVTDGGPLMSGDDPGVRVDAEESAAVLPFDGGPAEQAFVTQTVQVLPPGVALDGVRPSEHWTVLAPVTERGEALGLLEMCLPLEPDAARLDEIVNTAHVLGFVVIANRRYTDLFEWGQRTTPFTLPAEIQRRLLPASNTCEAGSFTLSGWLEPAADVGGDTYDYSLGRDVLHLSVTDAMGHDVGSALTATLCVGSLRNTRRKGGSLAEQAAAANTALHEHAPHEGFTTGLLGRLELKTGTLTLICAGHVAPYLARDGQVAAVDLPAGLPLGLFADAVYDEMDVVLQPGDRLVMVTDGMLERNAASLDLIGEIGASRSLHPRDTTRHLADNVVRLSGPALADDATLLVLDWHGSHGSPGPDRATVAGVAPAETG